MGLETAKGKFDRDYERAPRQSKNDGIQEADMETKAEYRKLRNERDQLTKQLAGVSS